MEIFVAMETCVMLFRWMNLFSRIIGRLNVCSKIQVNRWKIYDIKNYGSNSGFHVFGDFDFTFDLYSICCLLK